MAYRPRIVDDELRERLEAAGAVVIEGPKACGKTATGREVAESAVALDTDEAARKLARLDPALILEGKVPRLLDEWQLEPSLWNHVRREIDKRQVPGQFVLTGSAVPADDVVRHSGAGRLSRLRMRPMSLVEAGASSGEVSLAALVAGEAPRATDTGHGLTWVAEQVALGGWPGALTLPLRARLRYVADYVEEVCRTDIRRVDGVDRDPVRVRHLMRSLARHVATEASLSTIAKDVDDAKGPSSTNTIRDYLSALERLMVVEDQPAWGPHLRSRSRVRGTSKRHFTDPSIAVAALGATPDRLISDPNLLGFLFESLAIRDLRILAQPLGGRVFHYRDNTGLEADAIVEMPDGRWLAFEVKLGTHAVDEGAAALLRLADRVDHERCGPPLALAVITGTGYAYLRPDGVAVIPLGALGA